MEHLDNNSDFINSEGPIESVSVSESVEETMNQGGDDVVGGENNIFATEPLVKNKKKSKLALIISSAIVLTLILASISLIVGFNFIIISINVCFYKNLVCFSD